MRKFGICLLGVVGAATWVSGVDRSLAALPSDRDDCGAIERADVRRIFDGPASATRDGRECYWNIRDRYWVVYIPLHSYPGMGAEIFRNQKNGEPGSIREVDGVWDDAYFDSDATASRGLNVRDGDFIFILQTVAMLRANGQTSFALPASAARDLRRLARLVVTGEGH